MVHIFNGTPDFRSKKSLGIKSEDFLKIVGVMINIEYNREIYINGKLNCSPTQNKQLSDFPKFNVFKLKCGNMGFDINMGQIIIYLHRSISLGGHNKVDEYVKFVENKLKHFRSISVNHVPILKKFTDNDLSTLHGNVELESTSDNENLKIKSFISHSDYKINEYIKDNIDNERYQSSSTIISQTKHFIWKLKIIGCHSPIFGQTPNMKTIGFSNSKNIPNIRLLELSNYKTKRQYFTLALSTIILDQTDYFLDIPNDTKQLEYPSLNQYFKKNKYFVKQPIYLCRFSSLAWEINAYYTERYNDLKEFKVKTMIAKDIFNNKFGELEVKNVDKKYEQTIIKYMCDHKMPSLLCSKNLKAKNKRNSKKRKYKSKCNICRTPLYNDIYVLNIQKDESHTTKNQFYGICLICMHSNYIRYVNKKKSTNLSNSKDGKNYEEITDKKLIPYIMNKHKKPNHTFNLYRITYPRKEIDVIENMIFEDENKKKLMLEIAEKPLIFKKYHHIPNRDCVLKVGNYIGYESIEAEDLYEMYISHFANENVKNELNNSQILFNYKLINFDFY